MNRIVVAAACALLAASAQAADWGLSASVGTTGLGVHASTPIMPQLNARFGGNFYNYSKDTSTASVNYDAKLKLQSIDLLADYFPMSNPFHVSAGIVYNNTKLTATGRSTTGTYTLNGTVYTLGSLNGNIDFRKLAPYLGVGWGNPVAAGKGWGFTSDLGVMFEGSPRSNLTATGCTGANCGTLASDLAVENARLQDKLKHFKAYPVVRVGASYKF